MCGPCRAVFRCNAVGRVAVHVRVGCGEGCQEHVMQWCVGARALFGCEQQAVWEWRDVDVVVGVEVVVVDVAVAVSEAPTAVTASPLRWPRRCCCRRCRRHCVGVSLCAVCMWKCWCWGVCECLQCIVHAQGVARARRNPGSGARMAGIRDELRTSRVMAGAALGPARPPWRAWAEPPSRHAPFAVCSQRLFPLSRVQ